MLPDPLHPAVVHFPIVLAVLVPISVLVALWAIRRGAEPARTWTIPLILTVVMALSGWAALETGEDQEEAVEEVVAEEPLHEHEEAGERFLLFSGVLAAVAFTGLAGGMAGAAGRIVTLAGSAVVLAAGVQVGSLGGELVYQHGAAAAYVNADGPGERGSPGSATRVALPGLFTIMAGLEEDMVRVSRGLWTGQLDSVAVAARAIANHPTVPSPEAARIAEILGSDMADFKSFDTRVHDLSIELAEHARAGDLAAVLSTEARLREGCANCHDTFRERIRQGVR